MKKHKSRYHKDGPDTHSHQGLSGEYPNDECPHCLRDYAEENALEMVRVLESVLRDLPYVPVTAIRDVLSKARPLLESQPCK